MPAWTEEQTKTAKVLRGDGLPYRAIGEALGKSSEAVRKHFDRQESGVAVETSADSSSPTLSASVDTLVTKAVHFLVRVTRVAAVFDYHWPHNINPKPLLAFLRHFKPDEFIAGGDWWDLGLISHHRGKSILHEGYESVRKRFGAEVDGFSAELDKFRAAIGNAKFIHIEGNHEDWLNDWNRENPQIRDTNIEALLKHKFRRIEFVPNGRVYRVGKIIFAHGDQKAFSGSNPAKTGVERFRKTVVFGHHHVWKVWPSFSMADEKDKHLGIAVPCFSTLSPEYVKDNPHAWMAGFFTASIKRSGNFSAHVQLVSPKGEFMDQYGREWK